MGMDLEQAESRLGARLEQEKAGVGWEQDWELVWNRLGVGMVPIWKRAERKLETSWEQVVSWK